MFVTELLYRVSHWVLHWVNVICNCFNVGQRVVLLWSNGQNLKYIGSQDLLKKMEVLGKRERETNENKLKQELEGLRERYDSEIMELSSKLESLTYDNEQLLKLKEEQENMMELTNKEDVSHLESHLASLARENQRLKTFLSAVVGFLAISVSILFSSEHSQISDG